MTPWTDRAGKFSPLKAATLAVHAGAGAVLLALVVAGAGHGGRFGPRPLTEAIHETGDWAIRFLVLSLAVTPLRRLANWPKLIMVRRMLGLAALFYALVHLVALHRRPEVRPRQASPARSRCGSISPSASSRCSGLVVLGATSTDAMIKRLGGNWNRLHKIVYGIGILAAIHFFMQTKADVFEATIVAGLLILLLFYRLAHWRGFALASPVVVAGLAVLAALATAGREYAWYGMATGIPPGRVLAANLAVRPSDPAGLVGAGGRAAPQRSSAGSRRRAPASQGPNRPAARKRAEPGASRPERQSPFSTSSMRRICSPSMSHSAGDDWLIAFSISAV